MSDNRIIVAQIGLGLVMLAAYRYTGDQWNVVMTWCVVAIVALRLLHVFLIRRREQRLIAEAHAEWRRELQERLEIEMSRGVTDTMACFLVEPVMERRWPVNAAAARLYLDARRQQRRLPPVLDLQAVEVRR